jgi:predicted O-methyltransferase YrrM
VAARLRNFGRRLRLPAHERHARRVLAQLHSRPRSLEDLVAAACDLGTRGLVKVKTQQRRGEILRLARRVQELAPRNVLEIGTWRGGTLLIWSALASRQVVTCDLEQPDYRRRLYAAFPPPGSSCRVVALAGDSHAPATRERIAAELADEPLDFLFVDGDHTAAGVTADYEAYKGLVRPGGLVAFHDIVERQPLPDSQVHRLWQRLRAEHEVEEYVDDPVQCGFGIGVLRIPA